MISASTGLMSQQNSDTRGDEYLAILSLSTLSFRASTYTEEAIPTQLQGCSHGTSGLLTYGPLYSVRKQVSRECNTQLRLLKSSQVKFLSSNFCTCGCLAGEDDRNVITQRYIPASPTSQLCIAQVDMPKGCPTLRISRA